MQSLQHLEAEDDIEWRFIEDCGGVIEEIAMAIPPTWFTSSVEAGTLHAFGCLIKALEQETSLLLLVEAGSSAGARQWIGNLDPKCSVKICDGVPAGEMDHKSCWIQDAVHVRYIGRRRRFEKALSENPGNHADWLARDDGSTASALDLHLAGGNQIVGDSYRIVGEKSLEFSSQYYLGAKGNICAALERIAGLDPRPTHIFGFRAADLSSAESSASTGYHSLQRRGPPHQCGFHVDTFVASTGISSAGQPLILVADAISAGHSTTVQVINIKKQLDASAARLAQRGFKVLRNPVPYAVCPENGKSMPRLYNNVIVENDMRPARQKPLVWLPVFGDDKSLRAFDDENVAIWRQLGFEVIQVEGWNSLAHRNGALRCATKILRRTGRSDVADEDDTLRRSPAVRI